MQWDGSHELFYCHWKFNNVPVFIFSWCQELKHRYKWPLFPDFRSKSWSFGGHPVALSWHWCTRGYPKRNPVRYFPLAHCVLQWAFSCRLVATTEQSPCPRWRWCYWWHDHEEQFLCKKPLDVGQTAHSTCLGPRRRSNRWQCESSFNGNDCVGFILSSSSEESVRNKKLKNENSILAPSNLERKSRDPGINCTVRCRNPTTTTDAASITGSSTGFYCGRTIRRRRRRDRWRRLGLITIGASLRVPCIQQDPLLRCGVVLQLSSVLIRVSAERSQTPAI